MEPKDGGPAYPVPSDGVSFGTHPGMSLRDHFAGLAMQGKLACGLWSHLAPEQMASTAYQIADAMIAERERGR